MLRKLFVFVVCLMAAITTASAQTPPDNEIWYTTANGEIADLYIGKDHADENGEDFEILSHTYKNGKGVIRANKPIKTYGYVQEGGWDYGFCIYGEIESIILPKSLATIEYEPFRYSYSLKSITIPDSITEIGNWAFSGCSSLTSITIGNSVTEIGSWAFEGCSSLKSITIPNSVTSIENCAFQDCSSLKSITIGNSVTSIGNCAFQDCNSLKSITIPNSVTSIGWYAFSGCDALKDVNVNITNLAEYCKGNAIDEIPGNKHLYINNKEIAELVIPNSVTSIGDDAFKGCSSLTSITIPESVTSIGEGAFHYCSSLKSVKVANKYCYDYFKDKVANIAFYGANASDDGRCLIIDGELKIFIAKGITEYTIPNSVTEIEGGTFRDCSSLKSITIPNSVTSIGLYAFSGCSSLKSITIPNGVTSIEYGTFWGCSSLTSITIPNSVTSIEEYAFYDCSSLTSITIGNSVTSIGKGAFYGCSSLTSITCLATTPPAIDDLRIRETTMIYVPKKSVKLYKNAEVWSRYKKQIKRIK